MSHWAELKCEIKCSIDVMRRALLKINPEWERHMEISQEGTLEIDNQYMGGRGGEESHRRNFNIKVKGVRGGGSRDLPYADLGLRKNEDGSWKIVVDRAGPPHIQNLTDHVGSVLAQLKAIQKANECNGAVLSQEYDRNRGTTITYVEVEVDDGEPDYEGISY